MSEIKIPADHFIADHPGSEPPLRVTPQANKPAKPERIDLQDALIVLGFVAFVGGVAAIHVPTALIVAGLMFLGGAVAIERAKNPNRNLNLTKLRRRKKEDEE